MHTSASVAGVVGLIGDPVAQSLSPAFQQAAFDACGLHVRYELWQSTTAQIPARLQRIREGSALGANVTVPHKEAVVAHMDDLSPTARRIGAVNTIVRVDGALIGHNTDAHGFIVPLRDRGFDFASGAAVVIGAGGASRAVVVALLEAGIRSLAIVNRTRERAERMALELADERIHAVPLADVAAAASGASLVVNATSLGWQSESSPVDRATLALLTTGALAYDLTYRTTPFLRSAGEAGIAVIDGLPMLVHQGAHAFELWTGIPAPLDLMWTTAVAARQAKGN